MQQKKTLFKYCQAELGECESTDSIVNMGLEDSSMETQDKSLRKAEGASKNFKDYLLGVHEKNIFEKK